MSYNRSGLKFKKRWLIIKNNYNNIPNEYITEGKVTKLKINKKDDTILEALIDTEDLQRSLDKGTWFAQWHKNFNSYLVQTLCAPTEGKQHGEKQTLQSFLLGLSPKAPIRHLNGNTLDNRKVNLQIYDQNTINDYRIMDGNTIAIILRDKFGKEIATTLVDTEDLPKVVNNDSSWVHYIFKQEPYAVSNTKDGRVYMDRFIMNTEEDILVHHINLNPLDNRKSNLENMKRDNSNLEVEQ
ncbi:MAG TPA: hypothetical protein VIK72_00760 [Clostridiaceae bacterium]